MTTLEMTTPAGGGQGEVVRGNTLKNHRNDYLTTTTPHSPIIPHSSRVGVLEEAPEVGRWTFGTGGRCGEAFAAARARMLADTERLGVRGALEHWTATGAVGPATLRVLTERDLDAMQRAFIGGVP